MSIAQKKRTARIRLNRSSNGMLMTPEEFDAVTDHDDRFDYELVHGVLVVVPPPGEAERDPNGELEYLLRLYRASHPRGSILDKTLSEQFIRLADSRRRADRVIWVGLGRVPDIQKDVPAIVVEFVSKRKRDRVRDYEEKRREYLAIGVSEYWIVDRFKRTLTVVRNAPGQPSEIVVQAEETYQSPLLPGFDLPLKQLLRLADDWAAQKQTSKRDKNRNQSK
jgi:Uma2 family endonuclease